MLKPCEANGYSREELLHPGSLPGGTGNVPSSFESQAGLYVCQVRLPKQRLEASQASKLDKLTCI